MGSQDKSELSIRDRSSQAAAPLLEALLSHADADRHSWHMPGHRGGQAWPSWFAAALAKLDLTELSSTDDLNHPEGPAAQAMALTAAACGSGLTRFVTTGSTTALYILLAAAVGTGGSLLVAGTCHRSVLHAAGLLDLNLLPLVQTGFPPPDTQTDLPRFSLLPQAILADVERAVAAQPQCRAVLLTSPDYYGGCAELQAIASFLHESDRILLVDEAHGAHLPYGGTGRLPPSALAAGADACVQSGHKTLPVLTGGALLHVSANALQAGQLRVDDVDRLLPVFQTSSPSFPIAASLDYARQILCFQAEEQIDQQLQHLQAFRDTLPAWLMCQPGHQDQRSGNTLARDPLRLVITSRCGHSVARIAGLAHQLNQQGIDIEFADLTRLVLIPSLWQNAADWCHLSTAIGHSDLDKVSVDQQMQRKSSRLLHLEQDWRLFLQVSGQAISIREALFSRRDRRLLPLSQAVGWIVSRPLVPYPPGIALVRPGEQLEQDRVDFIRLLVENKIKVNGVEAGKVQVFA